MSFFIFEYTLLLISIVMTVGGFAWALALQTVISATSLSERKLARESERYAGTSLEYVSFSRRIGDIEDMRHFAEDRKLVAGLVFALGLLFTAFAAARLVLL